MRHVIHLLAFLIGVHVAGCTSQLKPASKVNPPTKPFVLTDPKPENYGKILLMEKGQTLSADELRAATLVRDHIESGRKERFDARYTVLKVQDGFEVTVYFVANYYEGEPGFVPGGFGGFKVSLPDWTVKLEHPGM